MTNQPDPPATSSDASLRARAEQQLTENNAQTAREKLLHELHVHQIELEMQNESLRQSQSALEKALEDNYERYAELYEFAPIGYLTLTQNGQIAEVNLTLTRLLGVERQSILQQRFSRYVVEEDADSWHRFFMRALSGEPQTPFYLRLRGADNLPLHVQIVYRRRKADSDNPELQLALTDISPLKQIEQRLRISDESLRMALNYSPNALLIVNQNGNFTYANLRAKELYGYTAEEFEALNIAETLPPEATQSALAAFQRNLAGSYESIETTILNKRGQRIEVEISGVRLPGGSILGEVRDITEIKKAIFEQARYRDQLEQMVTERSLQTIQLYNELGKHQQLLQSIIDNAPASIYVKDLEGRYLLANHRYLKILNLDIEAESIIGRCDHEFFTPEATQARLSIDNVVISTQATQEYEEVVQQADGLHTWMSHTFPLHDAFGKVYAICGIANDISESKLAQQRIHQSEARLKEAQRIARIGNWDFDILAGRLIWSDELYRIYEIDPACQVPSYELVLQCTHPDDREALDQAFKKAIADHTTYEFSHRLVMPDGRIKYTNNLGETYYRSDGTPYRSIGTVHDITAQRQTEEKLRALQLELDQTIRMHAVNQTIAAIAHELHQPLSAIAAYSAAALRLMQTGNKQPEKMLHALASSTQQAQRAGAVVRELLTFMRQTAVETEDVDINKLVKTTLNNLHIDPAIQFQPWLTLDTRMNAVRANPLQIEKVLNNLIQNSIDAMRSAGINPIEVNIATRPHTDPNLAEIILQDHGPRIDQATLARMFDPFFTTKPNGLGMGLPISRAIIEAHGGKLWAESGEETGMRFHMTLPFAARTA